MIEKIIANGENDAAAAALDIAIKLGLEYAGWCHRSSSGIDRYRLEPLDNISIQSLLEMTVQAADGSLLFVNGESIGLRCESIKRIAQRLNKALMVIDLDQERGFFASRRIAAWISENRISALHVDGDDDPGIPSSMHKTVAKILEATFFLALMDTGITSPLSSVVDKERLPMSSPPPDSMPTALDHLERSLSLKDKATIANMVEDELVSLHFTLGAYINRHFDLYTTNTELLSECQRWSGQPHLTSADAAAVIIRELWERLRDSCRIRIIK